MSSIVGELDSRYNQGFHTSQASMASLSTTSSDMNSFFQMELFNM